MSYIRCAVCRGQKKVKGLGCMIKKCYACDGAGYIKQDVEESKETVQDTVKDDTTEKTVEDTSKTESTTTKRKSHWSKKQ